MRITKVTSNIGALVEDIDLINASDDEITGLQWGLLEHHVLFFRDQHFDTDSHIAFTERWGAVLPHPVAAALGSTDTLGRVYNDADHPPNAADSAFHTDYTFHTAVPDLAVLRAVTVPEFGGDTVWANMAAAYDALSPAIKAFVGGLTARHDQGPRFQIEMTERYGAETADRIGEMFPGSTHPVVIAHPVTSRPTLFVNRGFTRSIVGLSNLESQSILDMLFGHTTNPSLHCRFRWEAGSVAIWDEHATVHRGPNDFGTATRELHRYTAGQRSPIPVL